MKKKRLAVDYAASIMSRDEYLAEVKSGKTRCGGGRQGVDDDGPAP